MGSTSLPCRALLVMQPRTFALQFGAEQLRRLRTLAALPDPVSVAELESATSRRLLSGADVLITSWGAPALTAGVLDAAPDLKLVLHCAGSVRRMVTQEVHHRGITVSTSADINAIPVAEYTLAAIIMSGKKVPYLSRRPEEGWSDLIGRSDLSNRGRRIGIIGFSKIGRRVMELLRVLEVGEVLVHDPYADAAAVEALGGRLTDLDDVLKNSEIVSLHAPALPTTVNMIGARELSLMPDDGVLINTARGVLVDHDALTEQCRTGRLHAILDVTDPEPLPADHALYGMDNVMITPHLAGSLGGETRRMSDHAIDELARWRRGEPLLGALSASMSAVSA